MNWKTLELAGQKKKSNICINWAGKKSSSASIPGFHLLLLSYSTINGLTLNATTAVAQTNNIFPQPWFKWVASKPCI